MLDSESAAVAMAAGLTSPQPGSKYQRFRNTVGVAQLVEPRLVVPVVAGSSPVTHPT